jgi:hypothetical protein
MSNRQKPKKYRKPFSSSKPVIPVPKPPPARRGPVFYAKWSDGVETCMSIYSGLDCPDIKRAVAVSQAAHSSRTKGKSAAIVSGHFETADGEVLRSYSSDEIEKAITTEQPTATDPQARVREHELVDLTADLARVADEVGMFDDNPIGCDERDDWGEVIGRAVDYLPKEEARIKQT